MEVVVAVELGAERVDPGEAVGEIDSGNAPTSRSRVPLG
jgi:hypothetical protein